MFFQVTAGNKSASYLKMSNYHMMVRNEVMRGRFRNSFSKPEPFVANEKTAVNIKLQDVFHTFKGIKSDPSSKYLVSSNRFESANVCRKYFYAKPEFSKQTHHL
jgi:hypothetical protein